MSEAQSYHIVNERVRDNALAAVALLPTTKDETEGNYWVVRIEPEKKSRTQRQNRYLWGVVYKTIVENDPGFFGDENTVNELRKAGIPMAKVVHEYCKRCFLPGEVIALPIDEYGDNMELFRVEKSTTKLTRQEFNEYVENIRHWAAEGLRVFIPDPTACGYDDLAWRRDG